MSIETMIFAGVAHTFASPVPAIMQSVVDVRSDVARFESDLNDQIAVAERRLLNWIAEGDTARRQIWDAFSTNPVSADHIALVDRTIEALAKRNEESAQQARAFEKRFRRMVKDGFALSPSIGAIVRQAAKRSTSLLDREIAERAEFGLFLQALRAEFGPDQGGETSRTARDLLAEFDLDA